MDPQQVAESLRLCLEPNNATRDPHDPMSPATQNLQRTESLNSLQKMETQAGFATALLQIYDGDSDVNTRFLAVSMVSNVVDRRWSARTGSTLSDNEKALVKTFLLGKLSALHEVVHYPAFLKFFRKVARVQFPARWPESVEWWLARWQRQGPDDELALETFHYLMKDQAKKTLLVDKTDFHKVAPALMDVLGPTWLNAENASSKTRYHLDGIMGILFNNGVAHLREHPRGKDYVQSFVQRVETPFTHDEFGLRNKKKLVKQLGLLIRNHPRAFTEDSLCRGLDTVRQLCADSDCRLQKQCFVALTQAYTQKSLKDDNTFRFWTQKHFDELLARAQNALRRTEEDVEAILQGDDPETVLRTATKTFVEAIGAKENGAALAAYMSKEFARQGSDPLSMETILIMACTTHPVLKEQGLGFSTMLEKLVVPTLSLVSESGVLSLLPTASCRVLKQWADDAPVDSLTYVAEIIFTYLTKGGSLGLRCACLSPLREFLLRFMESPHWDTLYPQLVPSLFELISHLEAPQEIWKCLSLFLMVVENSSEDTEGPSCVALGLRALWIKHRNDELLTDAILDVLRSLTLLPITLELSETLAFVLLDLFSKPTRDDMDHARLCLLGAMRTVPVDRCEPYRRLVPTVLSDVRQMDTDEPSLLIAVDVLLEMAVLDMVNADADLSALCQKWLEPVSDETGLHDRALRLLLLDCNPPSNKLVEDIVRHFFRSFAESQNYQLPIQAVVPLICAFVQRNPLPPEDTSITTERTVSALASSLRSFRRQEAKVAAVRTMMSLQPAGGDWFFPSIHEVLRVDAYTPVHDLIRKWTSKARIPRATRVQRELDRRWNCIAMTSVEVHAWVKQVLLAFGSVEAAIEKAPPQYRDLLRMTFAE